MSYVHLEKSKWEDYFNRVSKSLKDTPAEIEVEALGILDKYETDWISLVGISYDPKDDVISIYFEEPDLKDFDHIIRHPQDVAVEEGDDGLLNVEITGGQGYKHVIRFKQAVPVQG